ncbi:ABC transporter substrate-binding protein [Actinorhabdospora filicis]|uniref:ABC transporter substrate-binding protein n=1 Tax=Actinorhabdospora filicis TaxID=1785913 RepID=UPI002556C005|nr:ABC transporter substrate-binding protein [Actinorhabdospora filicis]
MAAIVTASVIGACTEPQAPAAPSASSAPVKGGTLVLLDEAEYFDTLDPQEVYVLNQANLSTLIYRTLVSFTTVPGETAVLAPDLATDLGRPSNGNQTWEFTLRDGVKWENGEPVTCEQVAYGVSRAFDTRNGESAVVKGGPAYPRQVLDVPESYTGPYTQPDADFSAVECPDRQTVRFHLKHPVGDFPYMLTLPVFSPVLKMGRAKEEAFDRGPLSNGPYKIIRTKGPDDKNGVKGELILERNAYWDPAVDSIRPARPDRIEVRYGADREVAAQQILTGNPEYANAVIWNSTVTPNFVQQIVNDPALLAHTLTGPTNSLRYLSINTSKVTGLACRQALIYAFDRRKFLSNYGSTAMGEYASTMIPPGSPGYKDFDLYGARSHPDGDLDKARDLWGASCPSTLVLDHADTGPLRRAVESIVETYGRLGVRVKPNPIPLDRFFPTIQDPRTQGDLTLASWNADWPNGSGTLPALYHSASIVPGSNLNYAQLDDKGVDGLIDAAMAEPDLAKQYALWGEADQEIARLAPTVPISWGKALQLMGSNVRGAVMHPQYGMASAMALGLASA